MEKFSVLMAEDLNEYSAFNEAESRIETEKCMDQLQVRASTILKILVGSKDFLKMFLCAEPGDLHMFTHSSKRIIVIDALTRCSPDQLVNFDTYNFTAHPNFENKITAYTRSANKPNPQLSKNRSWDVALNVILKVEALDGISATFPNARLLFREFNILKYIWDCYLRENMDLDEMTGIPMVFDYSEVPNPVFNYERTMEYKIMDIYGSLVPWKSDNPTTMSYMSMEKMGPTIRYLQELMVHTKRRTRTFDLETSFKVFDQLICRCLQLHRFGIVHNCVEPRNIYLGRSVAFNVVYLGNYSKSMILDSKERKPAEVFMGGDPRYTSQSRVSGTAAYPMQDIESAFYTLLSMIVSNLPWDVVLVNNDAIQRTSEIKNASNYSKEIADNVEVREMKSAFWKSQGGINRMLADIRYLTLGNEAVRVNLATEIIRELFGKMRDQLEAVVSRPIMSMSAVGGLMSQQTSDFQFYVELRRAVLLFFRFESISVSFCTPTYQKKIEAIAREEHEPRPAWNISNWCFNVVQMNAPGNVRLSMIPVDFVARTTD